VTRRMNDSPYVKLVSSMGNSLKKLEFGESPHSLMKCRASRIRIALLAMTLAFATAGTANAAGFLKGAVVGGVAGHYAGHHAVVGGCVVGSTLPSSMVNGRLSKRQSGRSPMRSKAPSIAVRQ